VDAKVSSVDIKFDAKFALLESKIALLDPKIEGLCRDRSAEIRRVAERLSADFVRLESQVDPREVDYVYQERS